MWRREQVSVSVVPLKREERGKVFGRSAPVKPEPASSAVLQVCVFTSAAGVNSSTRVCPVCKLMFPKVPNVCERVRQSTQLVLRCCEGFRFSKNGVIGWDSTFSRRSYSRWRMIERKYILSVVGFGLKPGGGTYNLSAGVQIMTSRRSQKSQSWTTFITLR